MKNVTQAMVVYLSVQNTLGNTAPLWKKIVLVGGGFNEGNWIQCNEEAVIIQNEFKMRN